MIITQGMYDPFRINRVKVIYEFSRSARIRTAHSSNRHPSGRPNKPSTAFLGARTITLIAAFRLAILFLTLFHLFSPRAREVAFNERRRRIITKRSAKFYERRFFFFFYFFFLFFELFSRLSCMN